MTDTFVFSLKTSNACAKCKIQVTWTSGERGQCECLDLEEGCAFEIEMVEQRF